MDVLSTPAAMRAWRRSHAGSVGFVPTMGYLHEGHISLVRQSTAENEHTVVSIFVNPAQFAPNEDYERYPRDEVRDLTQLEQAGVGAVYLPTSGDMYPEGYQTWVDVESLTKPLEGERRPGHFRGVTTVVLKLLNAVGPDRAYFGRKDAQQLRVVDRMVRDLDLGVEIVPSEIVREPDGLAMSSRNVYLSPEHRSAAPIIYQALCAARTEFEHGERDADRLRFIVAETISRVPGAQIDYVSLADDATLVELKGTVDERALLSVVVRFGHTRLLDNIELS
ncbi:MAG TPA: pantoate--beta-alanine ligase [Tepidiformaceae bacterium]|nr:pantoate--beta-alanine ligase [Tepidiformaceae bacterium]